MTSQLFTEALLLAEFDMFGSVHLDLPRHGDHARDIACNEHHFRPLSGFDATAVDLRSALAEAGRSSASNRRQ